jgi:hypothetical protein
MKYLKFQNFIKTDLCLLKGMTNSKENSLVLSHHLGLFLDNQDKLYYL